MTTDVTGIMTVTNLAAGTYLVKEIKGPEGYQIDTATQKVARPVTFAVPPSSVTTVVVYAPSILSILKREPARGALFSASTSSITSVVWTFCSKTTVVSSL